MNPFDAPNFDDVVAHHVEGNLGFAIIERDDRRVLHVVLLIDNKKTPSSERVRKWRRRQAPPKFARSPNGDGLSSTERSRKRRARLSSTTPV